eukprot:TRINITY_DN136569_c0_g1_i1.p1 TRINITY_DN136569_c0_g1~~TRINITY_DN136569_c0_g1_i1.p1  ORF type:complete len:85 (-),score=9.40 TRINITY_DN136569_c0_g1_i1:24-248(-)
MRNTPKLFDNLKLDFNSTPTEYPEWAKKRRPGNILIGLGLTGLVAGIYMYTMKSISKDDFAELENERKVVAKKN